MRKKNIVKLDIDAEVLLSGLKKITMKATILSHKNPKQLGAQLQYIVSPEDNEEEMMMVKKIELSKMLLAIIEEYFKRKSIDKKVKNFSMHKNDLISSNDENLYYEIFWSKK